MELYLRFRMERTAKLVTPAVYKFPRVDRIPRRRDDLVAGLAYFPALGAGVTSCPRLDAPESRRVFLVLWERIGTPLH